LLSLLIFSIHRDLQTTTDKMRCMTTPSFTPAERRDLKARAHALNPVLMISEAGLSPSVLAEAERCLKSHELIKIRVFSGDRDTRGLLLQELCLRTGALPVQHIGKILVIYRKNPEANTPKRKAPVRKPRRIAAEEPPRRGFSRPYGEQARRPTLKGAAGPRRSGRKTAGNR
jgi:RNA-binding protein